MMNKDVEQNVMLQKSIADMKNTDAEEALAERPAPPSRSAGRIPLERAKHLVAQHREALDALAPYDGPVVESTRTTEP